MRNLKILNKGQIKPDSITCPDLPLITSSFDIFTDSVTFILGSQESGLIEVQQFMKDGTIRLLASFPMKPDDKILSFAHFSDSSQLIFIFSLGDIVTATYDSIQPDSDTTLIEIVGSIDSGLECAQWSHDEESLVLVTGDNSLVILSRLFEPVAEKFLNPNDLIINHQVSLGWGKEETQFKGRGAKQIERERQALKHAGLNIDSDNAILHDPTVKQLQRGSLSLFDSKACKISWRGDCQFFSLSSIEEIEPGVKRRVIRVYSRDGELISTSEAVDGHEDTLSWKPQGSLIASTQRRFEEEIDEEVLDVIFFEKNGLRHGEFTSRLEPGSKISDLHWSSNSEIIALQLFDSIQIWSTKNYYWYLKQEIFTDNHEPIEFVKFHPEKSLRIMMGTSKSIEIIDMMYTNTRGPTVAPYDIGMTLIADGTTCMMTPFSIANVPPPISFKEIDVEECIRDMAVSQDNTKFAILTHYHIYFTSFKMGKIIKNPEICSRLDKSEFADESDFIRQVSIVENSKVYVLFDSLNISKIAEIDITDITKPIVSKISEISPYKVVSIEPNSTFEFLTYQTVVGSVYRFKDNISELIQKFPQVCNDFMVVNAFNEELQANALVQFGLMSNGKLYVNEKIISQGVTSMLITDSYLLYTTAQHQLKFFHLLNNASLFDVKEIVTVTETKEKHDERTRMIERGSLLVTSMPSKSSVILQAPRGNLETIYPRIMVLNDVRKAIKKKDYIDAFLACRTHRIALDILHDYNPQLFYNNVELFVNQLVKVEYLDLFLSCLLEEDVCETKYKETYNESNNNVQEITKGVQHLKVIREMGQQKVRKICDSVLEVILTKKYKQKYLQSIITAFACQKPPRTEEALTLIGSFTNDEEIEKSIQHLCFLLDVNKLYDIALSIYNIPLALVVAQQSQKDPKEYLPFLQGLYEQNDLRKRVMIDTYLKNYEKALESLIQITTEEKPDIQAEIVDFIIDHMLYKYALKLYRYQPGKFNIILKSYADYLHTNQEYVEAGLSYEKLNMYEEALENYVLGKKWREAIALALRPEFKHKLKEVCERLVDSLVVVHTYSAAAYIQFKYLHNIEESLGLYCKDYEFSQAIILCQEEGKPELVEKIIDPSLGEGFGTVAELLADCKGQIDSQLRRLRELRTKKEEDPFAFYGENAENADTPDNVSIAQSETSTRESFYTRYTGKTSGTAKTGASRRTAKNKRREERKRARGKKGTIYEEEYLIKSVGRLLERLETTELEAVNLIEGLLRRDMIEQAYQVQKNFVEVLDFLKENVVEIYSISEKDRERVDDRGIVYLIDEIPVPTIKNFPIKNVLDY